MTVHQVQFQKGNEAIAMCGASLKRGKGPLPWAGFLDHVTCEKCLARQPLWDPVTKTILKKAVDIEDLEWEDA